MSEKRNFIIRKQFFKIRRIPFVVACHDGDIGKTVASVKHKFAYPTADKIDLVGYIGRFIYIHAVAVGRFRIAVRRKEIFKLHKTV